LTTPPKNRYSRVAPRFESRGVRRVETAPDTDAGVMPVQADIPLPSDRSMRARLTTLGQNVASGAPTILAFIFILSLMLPIPMRLGSIFLQPYRIFLLLVFVPLFFQLISGKAGRLLLVDWLMFGSALWAMLALFMNHPFALVFETAGLYMAEFFGAYMLGRVAIRSGADFQRMVRFFFMIVLVLFPFAAIESLTHIPILLDLIPGSIQPVNAGVRLGLRRAQTVFAHPIHYGAFVSIAFGLAWYAFNPLSSFFARLARSCVIVLSTLFSLSTGALLAIVFQTIFILWELVMKANKSRWRLFAWLSVASYIFVDLLATRSPFHVIVNYATFSSGSAYNRILIWKYGTDNVIEHPLFGLGLNDWARPSWMSPSIDNYWLLIAMRYGLPTLLMFAAVIFLIIRRSSRIPMSNATDRASRAGYLTALGGVVIAGGTVHYWHGIGALVVFFISSGVWMLTDTVETSEQGPEPGPPDRRRAGVGRRP